MMSIPPPSQLATNTREASAAAAMCRLNRACGSAAASSQNGSAGTSVFVPTDTEFTNTVCIIVIVVCRVLLGGLITLTRVVMHGGLSAGATASCVHVVVLIV